MTDRNANRPGYKKTPVGWIPAKWDFAPLGKAATISSGGTPNRTRPEYWNGTIPWVTTGELHGTEIRVTSEHITTEGLRNSSAKMFPIGTLLMAMYGQGKTRGMVARLAIEATTNQACAAILPRPNLNGNYALYYLQNQYGIIRTLANSGAQQNLSADLIKSIPVPLPPLPEQKKIADILSTWDEAIEQARALTDAAKRRKKALMQQLLTGKKRLPGFATSWKKMQIGNLLEQVQRPVSWSDEATYSLLSVRRASGGVFIREQRAGKDILTKNMYLAKAGDFLISKMQVLHGATALVPEQMDGMHISGSYIALRPRDGATIDPSFLSMLSSTPVFYHLTYLSSYGVHIEKMTFNLDWFLESIIRIPSDIAEQRAIAAVLTTADDDIKSLEAKCAALERQKKGLMQKLLTGEVRCQAFAER